MEARGVGLHGQESDALEVIEARVALLQIRHVVRRGQKKGEPIQVGDIRLASWATLVDELGAEFVAGESRVAPIKSTTVCEYCRLQSVCRITALRADDGFDAEDDSDGAEV